MIISTQKLIKKLKGNLGIHYGIDFDTKPSEYGIKNFITKNEHFLGIFLEFKGEEDRKNVLKVCNYLIIKQIKRRFIVLIGNEVLIDKFIVKDVQKESPIDFFYFEDQKGLLMKKEALNYRRFRCEGGLQFSDINFNSKNFIFEQPLKEPWKCRFIWNKISISEINDFYFSSSRYMEVAKFKGRIIDFPEKKDVLLEISWISYYTSRKSPEKDEFQVVFNCDTIDIRYNKDSENFSRILWKIVGLNSRFPSIIDLSSGTYRYFQLQKNIKD